MHIYVYMCMGVHIYFYMCMYMCAGYIKMYTRKRRL